MVDKPLSFDTKKVDLKTGEITAAKKVYVENKIDSPSVVASYPIIGTRCSTFGKGSDNKNYRVDWDEEGKAENVTEC